MNLLELKININFLNNHIRRMCSENRLNDARELLGSMGITSYSLQNKIFRGKLKISSTNGDNNVIIGDEVILIDDDWNPYDNYDYYMGWGKPDEFFANEPANGWIAPNGYFYKCRDFSHHLLVNKYGLTERDAEIEGWIKISRHNGVFIFGNITKAQKNKLFDFCICYGMNYDEIIRGIIND